MRGTRNLRQRLLWLTPFVLLALAVLLLPVQVLSAPATREIHLDATQFAFAPGRVEVNQGDRIIFTVMASDVVHGFYLDGYGLETRVEPGITQQIEFTADQPGKFRFRCSVSCGPLHPFMIGELVVGSNDPFWRAVGLIGISLVASFVYLWRFANPEGGERE